VSEKNRPAWTLGRREAPAGLSAQRAWKWCLLRTVRDARLARQRGRPIAAHHLERQFARRWAVFEAVIPLAAWRGQLNLGREHIILGKVGLIMSQDKNEGATLTFELLKRAISGNAAAIRCRSFLQPAAGEGTKVFPPTYSGGVYANEKRRCRIENKTETIDCVLLDSVQSQANRMEEALQDAVDRGLFEPVGLPVIEVIFGDSVADVQRVTSLQAPHRAADAILRDSLLNGTPFRDSAEGKRITDSSLVNATALFEFCPTALVFGVWDSTGPKGGLGAKFARAIVSEIVGIDVISGAKTGSRIDPLAISKQAGPLFRRPDGGWTIKMDEAIQELDKNKKPTGRVVLYKQVKKKDVFFDPVKDAGSVPDAGKPSAANHGNVTPDLTRYGDSIEALGIKKGDIAAGGVTLASAEHTAVLSLPQLRRLRFPINGKLDPKLDDAARTALASLALVGLTLAAERGFDLRSRCLLFPDSAMGFELLETPGKPTPVQIGSTNAIAIFKQAVEAAIKLGLPWRKKLALTPSPQLIELVRKSQALAAVDNEGSDE
jgi:CRISPR-associated protein Csb1